MKIQNLSSGDKVGWLETVKIYPGKMKLVAKLDTGAKTSSIHTTSYRLLTREGIQYVIFKIDNKKGKTAELEKKVLRIVKIKDHKGKNCERPVVKLGILLADIYCDAEVNLVDRGKFNYPLLLGRRYMQQAELLVDSRSIFTTKAGRIKDAKRR